MSLLKQSFQATKLLVKIGVDLSLHGVELGAHLLVGVLDVCLELAKLCFLMSHPDLRLVQPAFQGFVLIAEFMHCCLKLFQFTLAGVRHVAVAGTCLCLLLFKLLLRDCCDIFLYVLGELLVMLLGVSSSCCRWCCLMRGCIVCPWVICLVEPWVFACVLFVVGTQMFLRACGREESGWC